MPDGQTSLVVQDRWDPAAGAYSLSIDCGFGGRLSLHRDGIAALTRMVPHIRGTIAVRERGIESPSDAFELARFGRGAAKSAVPLVPAGPAAQPPAPSKDTPSGAPGEAPAVQPGAQPAAPTSGAPAQAPEKPNPYAAMTVDQRADAVRKLLDKWLTGGDILQVFEACEPHDFLALQRKVDFAAVIDKLSPWQVVQLGARGPILAAQRQQVNDARADLIADITHSWGPERAQLFAHYMFSTMFDDDATNVLRLLAGGQHLHDTIDRMPMVGKLLDDRGIDRSKIRDRGWEWLDIPRGVGRGLSDIMSTSEAARGNEGMRALGMAQHLPSPYREAVEAVDRSALERAMTPGNMAFGALDHATMGLLSTAKGVVYDIPKAVVSGVGEIAEGHVASGVEQLTGPAIFILGAALGIRAYRKSARLAAMLELTEEGQALYGKLKTRIGAQGIDKVAKWVQGSSEAQILVRDEGAAGIEALYRAQGDVAAARAELGTSRAAAAKPTPPAVAPEAEAATTAAEPVTSPQSEAGAASTEGATLRGPARRHWSATVNQSTVAKNLNTVIEPGVDVAGDVTSIQAGKAARVNGNYIINGRTYGVHDGTLYPISGPGFHQLNRGAFQALGVLNKFGNTPQAHAILEKMKNVGPAEVDSALKAWSASQ